MDENIIRMERIYKQFPNVVALDHVDFSVEKGEIHGLVGENGAGKSTLVKILYGIYDADDGDIYIRGEKKDIKDAREAIDLGIGMVHQEFMLSSEMTVLENIILGFEPNNRSFLDYKQAYGKIKDLSDRYGLSVDPRRKVLNISVGEAQRVEIIKSLYRGAEVLILDEPTAVLTPQEAEELFEILRMLKKDGKTVIFISHKLDEIMEITDRMTVMRDGEKMATLTNEEATEKKLAKLMVGREVFLDFSLENKDKGNEVIEVKDLFASGKRELSKLEGISFSVHEGEIFGIAGVDGNGQSELVEVLTGLRPFHKGEIILKGNNIANKNPMEIRKIGVSHIPEDRNIRGLCKEMSLQDNLIANQIFKSAFSKYGIINFTKARDYSEELINKYDIRPPEPKILVDNLSGGNAQKTVVAREVYEDTDLLIASHPTRGVDIGSIEFIRSILIEEREENRAILLVSSDLEEILSLSDRIAVMFEGKIVDILDPDEATEERLGRLMIGGEKDGIEKEGAS